MFVCVFSETNVHHTLCVSWPADLDELAVHGLQCGPVLHSISVLQRLLPHLLLPLQSLLDYAAPPAGPRLLSTHPHHAFGGAVAQVSSTFFFSQSPPQVLRGAGLYLLQIGDAN